MPCHTTPSLIAEQTGWAMSNTFWLQVVNYILMNQAWPRWYLDPINTILSFSSFKRKWKKCGFKSAEKIKYRVLDSVQLPVTSGCVLSVPRIARVYLPPWSCGHSAEPFTLSSNTLSLSVWYMSKWVCCKLNISSSLLGFLYFIYQWVQVVSFNICLKCDFTTQYMYLLTNY